MILMHSVLRPARPGQHPSLLVWKAQITATTTGGGDDHQLGRSPDIRELHGMLSDVQAPGLNTPDSASAYGAARSAERGRMGSDVGEDVELGTIEIDVQPERKSGAAE